mgnify:CR=1 FL=1
MSQWEYKVVPAPTKGTKARGVKGPEGRFAHALETLMNDMGRDGWEYQRADTLPSVERSGLTGSTTEWRNVLVFRRTAAAALDDFEPELLPAPAPHEATPEKRAEPPLTHEPPDAEKATDSSPQVESYEGNAPKADGPKDILDVTASLKTLSSKDSGSKPES